MKCRSRLYVKPAPVILMKLFKFIFKHFLLFGIIIYIFTQWKTPVFVGLDVKSL